MMYKLGQSLELILGLILNVIRLIFSIILGGICLILSLFVVISLILIFKSEPTVVSEETFVDKVVVNSVDYSPERTYCTYVKSGMVYVPIRHKTYPRYNTTFTYKGEKFTIDSYHVYNQCKNLENKEVTCELKLITYKNKKSTVEIEDIVESH